MTQCVKFRALKGSRGFTLIELLIVVAIIGIIAAIAVPGLLRARMAGNESAALGALRGVNSAQSTYASSCGAGFFAPSLLRLATPPAVGGDGFIGPDLAADPATKSSYIIAVTPGAVAPQSPASCNGAAAGALVSSFWASASPAPGGGVRFFGLNQGGTIYQHTAAMTAVQNGAPSSGTPVQ